MKESTCWMEIFYRRESLVVLAVSTVIDTILAHLASTFSKWFVFDNVVGLVTMTGGQWCFTEGVFTNGRVLAQILGAFESVCVCVWLNGR